MDIVETAARLDTLLATLAARHAAICARLDACRGALEQLERALPDPADGASAAFARLVGDMNTQTRQLATQFDAAEAQATARVGEIERGLDDFAQQSDRCFAEWRNEITDFTTACADAGQAISDGLEQAGEKFDNGAREATEALSELMEETGDAARATANEVKETCAALCEEAGTRATELFTETFPGAVADATTNVKKVIEELDRAGGRELGRLTDTIGGIRDQAHAITNLVEQVRPVLDLAARLT